jgi:hypothetical protein
MSKAPLSDAHGLSVYIQPLAVALGLSILHNDKELLCRIGVACGRMVLQVQVEASSRPGS